MIESGLKEQLSRPSKGTSNPHLSIMKRRDAMDKKTRTTATEAAYKAAFDMMEAATR